MPTSTEGACSFLLTIALYICPPLQTMLLFSVDYSTMSTSAEDAAVFC